MVFRRNKETKTACLNLRAEKPGPSGYSESRIFYKHCAVLSHLPSENHRRDGTQKCCEYLSGVAEQTGRSLFGDACWTATFALRSHHRQRGNEDCTLDPMDQSITHISTEPRLPTELECLIFGIAALSHPGGIPNLMLVSWRNAVKHLFIEEATTVEAEAIVTACHHITTLFDNGTYTLDVGAILTLQHIRRLALIISTFLERYTSDDTPSLFRNITHLELIGLYLDDTELNGVCVRLALIPAVTHVAFNLAPLPETFYTTLGIGYIRQGGHLARTGSQTATTWGFNANRIRMDHILHIYPAFINHIFKEEAPGHMWYIERPSSSIRCITSLTVMVLALPTATRGHSRQDGVPDLTSVVLNRTERDHRLRKKGDGRRRKMAGDGRWL
ncbi:hypothetical protein DFH08DRAFT_940265 [Mycena albidolilacea]|uniref:Uncharacterized protein n=1 Tax=Mycena albidolilacea TaxID=1033008 RepID=A0AAD7EJ34_9AGAR|nr:hypothetical protein DFH08DRAFT_940265 [Mycena albidolilacea]